ncbi:hypothetical protein QX226_22205 [Vibrio vulnificus]|nr:hypothetical protein [Vibrio parahaemolyticus]MCU8133453.1 hypothetical protein [Vibrio vulnificus]MDS1774030.1 hypothetical protein [Vibrio vulnificus]MDS1855054.1 hypothetical protein [Vibrio vulnificus]
MKVVYGKLVYAAFTP